jgi:hypothetical protein
MDSSSSYSSMALSVWPWLPLVSEQFNFFQGGVVSSMPTPSYPGGPMFSVVVVSLS